MNCTFMQHLQFDYIRWTVHQSKKKKFKVAQRLYGYPVYIFMEEQNKRGQLINKQNGEKEIQWGRTMDGGCTTAQREELQKLGEKSVSVGMIIWP